MSPHALVDWLVG